MKSSTRTGYTRVVGFTLVEVTLALGLLSFMLLAVIGLLSVGLESGRTAQVDTVQSLMIRQLQAFTRTNAPSGYGGGVYYYHFDGSTNAGASGSYFQCVVQTNRPATNVEAGNYTGISLEVSYPLSAPANHRNTNVFHASLVPEN